jgi:hypothetical protein
MFSSFGSELADKGSRSLKHRNVQIVESSGLITEVHKVACHVDTQLSGVVGVARSGAVLVWVR